MANIGDVLTIIIVLFVVGIATMFIVKIGHDVNTQLLNVPIINNTNSSVTVINSSDNALNSSDYIYLGLFIGLTIGIFIAAYFIGGIPILAPIYFFILIIFSFVGVIIQNVWIDIGSRTQLVTTVSNLPITNFILTHLGYFTVIIGLVSIIIMYTKKDE